MQARANSTATNGISKGAQLELADTRNEGGVEGPVVVLAGVPLAVVVASGAAVVPSAVPSAVVLVVVLAPGPDDVVVATGAASVVVLAAGGSGVAGFIPRSGPRESSQPFHAFGVLLSKADVQ